MKSEDLPKAYNPKESEDQIYELWEESGFFDPDVCVKKGGARTVLAHPK